MNSISNNEAASSQIKTLRYLVPTLGVVDLLLKKLSNELFQRIAFDYFTLRDFVNFSEVNQKIHKILNNNAFSKTICPILYQRIEELYPNVINLDKLGASEKLGLPEYKEPKPESIKSLKDPINFLLRAAVCAECSKDKKAVIVTMPEGWSIAELEKVIQAAVNEGILSARIEYSEDEYRQILEDNPIEETQKVVISNTIVEGSVGKSIEQQEELLCSKGFQKEFPGALTVVTVAFLRRILSRGNESSYPPHSENVWGFTRTKEKTIQGWTLCVGSDFDFVRDYVHIDDDNFYRF
jgi:hypothetical protein